MAAPSPATIVIACPQCGTRYRLSREQLAGGREVQCANCQTSWQVEAERLPAPAAVSAAPEPDDDRMFDAAAEATLDAGFAAAALATGEAGAQEESAAPALPSIEEIKRAIAPKPKRDKGPDAALIRTRMLAFTRRRDSMMRRLPTGRFRHTARIVGVSALLLLVTGGVAWRTEIVRQVPDLAGVYAGIGLRVNVVGLEFAQVRTLEMLRDGAPVLIVNARIVAAADRTVPVPPVVVTLLSDSGSALYEWSVKPPARDLGPGEAIDFETRLTQPPLAVARVRLSFTNQRTQPDSAASAPVAKGVPN